MKKFLLALSCALALIAGTAGVAQAGFSDGGGGDRAGTPAGRTDCIWPSTKHTTDVCPRRAAPAAPDAVGIHVFARYRWFNGAQQFFCLGNQPDPCQMYIQKPDGQLLIGQFQNQLMTGGIPGTHYWVYPGSWACCETWFTFTSSYVCCVQIGAGNVDMWARKPCPFNGGYMYSPVRRYYFNGHEPADNGLTLDLGDQYLDNPQYACQPLGHAVRPG